MTTRISDAVANAIVDTVVDRVDAGTGPGTLKVYTGTQPATADTAASGTLLATVTLADPAFGAASARTANATDPAAVTASGTGTAGWFRVEDSNAATVYDGAVTATGGGGELELQTTSLTAGVTVDITALSVSV